jgi:hypothetical protein
MRQSIADSFQGQYDFSVEMDYRFTLTKLEPTVRNNMHRVR